MGWINPEDRMPPEGLHVLCEISCMGTDEHGVTVYADHDFFIGFYLTPEGEEGRWFIEYNGTFYDPTVHAWMPLPKHYAPQEMFTQEPDLMEHSFFDDEPEWLYKDDAVYEQMSIEEFVREVKP